MMADEWASQRDVMAQEFLHRFIISADDSMVVWDVVWPLPADQDAMLRTGADYLVVMAHGRFEQVPVHLRVQTDLMGQTSQEQRMTITVTQDTQRELFTLTPSLPVHVFFCDTLSLLFDFLKQGVWHIADGLDHLMFIALLVLASRHWRACLILVSVFTLAHSLTLGLTVWGWLQVPSRWVEPVIGASIGWMAWMNWRHAHRDSHRWMVVFIFGLIHGMGFASALGELGVDAQRLWVSLLGFNLGVEAGQLIFVTLLAVMWWLAMRWPLMRANELKVRQTLAVLGCLGSVYFVVTALVAGWR
jgi:uncharacterized membrane protein